MTAPDRRDESSALAFPDTSFFQGSSWSDFDNSKDSTPQKPHRRARRRSSNIETRSFHADTFGSADVFGSDVMAADPWVEFSDDFNTSCFGKDRDDTAKYSRAGSDSSEDYEEEFEDPEFPPAKGGKEGTLPLRDKDHRKIENNKARHTSRGREGRKSNPKVLTNEEAGQKRRNRSRSRPAFVTGRRTRSLSVPKKPEDKEYASRPALSSHSRKLTMIPSTVQPIKEKSLKSKGEKSPKAPKAPKDRSPKAPKKSMDKAPKSPKGSKDKSPKVPKASKDKKEKKDKKASRSKSPRGSRSKSPKSPRDRSLRSKSPRSIRDLSTRSESSKSTRDKSSRSKSPRSPRGNSLRSKSQGAGRSKSPKTPKTLTNKKSSRDRSRKSSEEDKSLKILSNDKSTASSPSPKSPGQQSVGISLKKKAQKLFASPLPPKSYLSRGTQKRCYEGVSKQIDQRQFNVKTSLANLLSDEESAHMRCVDYDDDVESTASAPTERKRSSSVPKRNTPNKANSVEVEMKSEHISRSRRRSHRRHSVVA